MVPEPIIEAALRRNFGNLTWAAQELGLTRQALYHRLKGSVALRAAREDIDETILDLSESVMVQSIINGSEAMARFHLTQKGRSRGYGMRTELTGPGGGAIQLAAVPVENVAPTEHERELMRELLEARKRLTGE
jgi:hypothetical protein